MGRGSEVSAWKAVPPAANLVCCLLGWCLLGVGVIVFVFFFFFSRGVSHIIDRPGSLSGVLARTCSRPYRLWVAWMFDAPAGGFEPQFEARIVKK